jgi:hypothetical protein
MGKFLRIGFVGRAVGDDCFYGVEAGGLVVPADSTE